MSRRSGQTAVMMALSLTMIFGMMGFTVDLGSAYYQKQKAQGAVESAALAAATYAKANGVTCSTNGIACSSTPTSCSNISSGILYVGCQYANKNGFPMSSISMAANLTSSASPPCSNCGSPTYWIQASIATTNTNLFLGAADLSNPNINVQSIAGVTSSGGGGGGGGCVYVLNTTAQSAWSETGGNFTTGCGVYVDSNNSKAFSMTGGNNTFNGGSSLYIVGGENAGGGNNIFNGGGSVKTNQPSFSNPVSGLTAPTPNTPCTADPNISSGINVTIPSGTYCSLTVSGGINVIFSGTYIITTGAFKITGGTFSTAAAGTTFYFPSTNTKGVDLTGGNGTISAPTTGSLQGFAFWQDNSAAADITGGNTTVNGIIYMPNSTLTYTGSNTAATMSIVVNKMVMTGGNISKPATSSYFSNGGSATISTGFLVQ